jgi:abequosyltransferase
MQSLSNENLSVVIPTYNRASFLDFSLKVHIPIFQKYNIPIIISDNASNDHTLKVIKKWKEKYSLIEYQVNLETVSADKNIETALKLSESKYTWLLGDTYYLPLELVEKVLILANDCNDDMIICNLSGKLSIPSQKYTDQNKLLIDIGSLMTCLSCLIYHENVIKGGCFERYMDTSFLQLGGILEFINKKNFSIRWLCNNSVLGLDTISGLDKKNWSHSDSVLEIGAKKWTEFVLSLPPNYLLISKFRCIQKFGVLSNLFTLKGLALMRMRGHLTLSTYNKYSVEIGLLVKFPVLIVIFLSLFPRKILKIFYSVFRENLSKY